MTIIKAGTKVYGHTRRDYTSDKYRTYFTLSEDFDTNLISKGDVTRIKQGKWISGYKSSSVWSDTIRVADEPQEHPALHGNLTKDEVDELRKLAVRGVSSLRPGAYRYVYAGLSQYSDILVFGATKVDFAGRSCFGAPKHYEYTSLLHPSYFTQKGSLIDAGVIPVEDSREEVCNLGHKHESETRYADNFMVPITLSSTVNS